MQMSWYFIHSSEFYCPIRLYSTHTHTHKVHLQTRNETGVRWVRKSIANRPIQTTICCIILVLQYNMRLKVNNAVQSVLNKSDLSTFFSLSIYSLADTRSFGRGKSYSKWLRSNWHKYIIMVIVGG